MDFSDRETLDGTTSDRGTVTLSWIIEEGSEVELQQAGEANFAEPVVRYRGGDPGSVLTGLPEGLHYFRIRNLSAETEGEWSAPLEIRVEFVPRRQLFLLLGLGALVVGSTIVTIVAGHLNAGRKEATA